MSRGLRCRIVFFDVKYQVVGADHQNTEPKRRECTIYTEAFAGNFFLAAPSPLARRPAQLGPGFPLQVRLPAKPTHFGLSAPILGRQLTSRILRPTSQKLRSIILSEGSPNRNTELLQGDSSSSLAGLRMRFFLFFGFSQHPVPRN